MVAESTKSVRLWLVDSSRLCLSEWVDFKVAAMAFRMCCMSSLIWIKWFVSLTCPVVADFARRQHTFRHFVYRLSVVVCFPSPHLSSGIPCRWIFSFPFSACLLSTSKMVPFPEVISWDIAMTISYNFVSLPFCAFVDFEIVLLF